MNLKFSLLALFLFSSCAQMRSFTSAQKVKRNSGILKLAWAKNLDPKYRLGNLPIGWNTPLIEGERLYVGAKGNEFHVYNLRSGQLINSVKGESVVMRPVIKDNKIFYGTEDGHFFVKKLSTLEILYSNKFDIPLEVEPYIDGDTAYLHLQTNALISYNYKTKKVLWRYQRPQPNVTSLNRLAIPSVHDGKIFLGFADGYLACLDKNTGSVLWEKKISESRKFVDVDAKVLYHNGRVWVSSLAGVTQILNANDGSTMRRIKHKTMTQPLLYGEQVILSTDKGELLIFDQDGNLKTSLKVAKSGITSSALWGKKKIVFSTFKGKVGSLYLTDINSLDVFDFGYSKSSLLGHIEAKGDYLAVYSSRNRLYVFKQ